MNRGSKRVKSVDNYKVLRTRNRVGRVFSPSLSESQAGPARSGQSPTGRPLDLLVKRPCPSASARLDCPRGALIGPPCHSALELATHAVEWGRDSSPLLWRLQKVTTAPLSSRLCSVPVSSRVSLNLCILLHSLIASSNCFRGLWQAAQHLLATRLLSYIHHR